MSTKLNNVLVGTVGVLLFTVGYLNFKLDSSKLNTDIKFDTFTENTFNKNVIKSPIAFNPPYTGGSVELQLESNLTVNGTINTIQSEDGFIRIGGDFENGTFYFVVKDDSNTTGYVFLNKFVYEMQSSSIGEPVVFIKKKKSDVLCLEMPNDVDAIISSGTVKVSKSLAVVPILNSRSSAIVQLYLEFGGSTVIDPAWNGGKVIVAEPSGYTTEQIKTIFDTVTQRFASFNVNVTTDINKYNKAQRGDKVRVIVTPTAFFVGNGIGGISYINALYKLSKGFFTPTLPAWVFTSRVSVSAIPEAIAHEIGHTFGLKHDGTIRSEYTTGHDNWAPIMGIGYGKQVVQWSNGDYTGANNKEDDVSIIADTQHVGYINPINARYATIIKGKFSVDDYICSKDDARYYVFSGYGGVMKIKINVPQYSGLNTQLEILDSNYQSIYKNNPAGDLSSSAEFMIKSGLFYIKVTGAAEGNPTTTGYSNYGSIGKFTISGSLPLLSNIKTSGTLSLK